MRRLASVEQWDDIAKFASYLQANRIEFNVHKNEQGFDFYVMSEDDYEFALGEWERYRSHPDDPKFRVKAMSVETLLEAPKEKAQEEEKPKAAKRKVVVNQGGPGSVTIVLCVICVLVYISMQNPALKWLENLLMYSQYQGNSFYEIRQWQIWRLITPIFMHLSTTHIFFNTWMLYSLGSDIESQEGGIYLILQGAFFAVIVNTSQYLYSGAGFAGMSGVIYAQLGYIWIMARHSQKFNYFLSPMTIVMMLIWLGLGVVGILGNIANMQHLVGLIMGVMFGYVRSGELSVAIKQYFRKRR